MKFQFIIALCAVILNVTAQPNEETKTVFGNKKPHIGYFINPFCQFGEIAGSTAVIPGLGTGIIFDNKITLGLTYKFITSENTPVWELDNRLYLDQQYLGFNFGYSIFPEKVVHLNFPIEAGAGEMELDLKDSYEGQIVDVPQIDVWFAYIEPGIAIEINVWKYFKFNISAGYRFISDVTFRNLSEKDFMGFNYSAGLRIGLF